VSSPSKAVGKAEKTPASAPSRGRLPFGLTWRQIILKGPSISPYLGLVALVIVYASLQEGVLTIETLNLETTTVLALAVIGVGQTIVILTGGIDLSVGGVVSVTSVLFATRHIGDSTPLLFLWFFLCLLLGGVVGMLNGLIVTRLRLQPFIVTFASWSILSGIALWILPLDGGEIPNGYISFFNREFLGLGVAVWMIVLLGIFAAWFRRSRLGTSIRAIGSDRSAAFLAGARVDRTTVAAYVLSGLFAAAAGLLLTAQTATGSPGAGEPYVLESIAVVVIGGTYLAGGRGAIGGTIVAAYILVVITNVVFVLSLPPAWSPLIVGVLLIVSVGASSFADFYARRSS
jgi:ribose transport system permease protein